MPDPTACQFAGETWSPHPPAYIVTYQSAPLTGRHAGPGMLFTEALCRSHVDRRTSQVREAGGDIVSSEDLPQPPETPVPAPVCLDAIDPTATAPSPERFRPDWAVHPGEILGDLLAEQSLTPAVAAKALNWSPDLLARVVDGTQDVKEGMAADLARVFGLTAGAWLRLQATYSRWCESQAAAG